MKIILSPAKTISKTCERFSSGLDFSDKTKEILKNIPEVLVSKDYCKAFYMYDGMCYKNIKREEFDECDLEYIGEHLIIISALYGALKPFDLINPYRLDFLMKTKMGNLYNFWKDDIANDILKDTDFIVNLASEEFSKTVKKYISENQILDFEFYEKVDEKLKKHSTISKKARGMMLNFMTKNKFENIEDIKKFDKDGYGFVEEMSLENKFVFVKNS